MEIKLKREKVGMINVFLERDWEGVVNLVMRINECEEGDEIMFEWELSFRWIEEREMVRSERVEVDLRNWDKLGFVLFFVF